MKKIIAIASAAALGLGVAACDSSSENAAEEQAEAVDDANEAAIDQAEDTGQITDEQQPRYGQQIADAILPF